MAKTMKAVQVRAPNAPFELVERPIPTPGANEIRIGGRLVVVGADATPIEVSPLQLIGARRRISGWPSGHARDSEDTLNFSALTGAKAMIERYPLEKAEEAYQRMMKNEARFRVCSRSRDAGQPQAGPRKPAVPSWAGAR